MIQRIRPPEGKRIKDLVPLPETYPLRGQILCFLLWRVPPVSWVTRVIARVVGAVNPYDIPMVILEDEDDSESGDHGAGQDIWVRGQV